VCLIGCVGSLACTPLRIAGIAAIWGRAKSDGGERPKGLKHEAQLAESVNGVLGEGSRQHTCLLLITYRASGERCKIPLGSGAEFRPKIDFCWFSNSEECVW